MRSITISLLQSDLAWEDPGKNRDIFLQKIQQLPKETALVILPEMFTTGFTMSPATLAEGMDGETMRWLHSVAAQNKVAIAGSIAVRDKDKYHNRLIFMLPNGRFGSYDKRHLFAFAGEDNNYAGGDKRLIASLNGWRINLQVCYDLRFPVWTRQRSSGDAPEFDLLVYVANWPASRSYAWKTLLAARAIENQCYVIGVNRVGEDGKGISHSGDSMVIDPLGEILHDCKGSEDAFTITLEKEKLHAVWEKFPFWKDADTFDIKH